MRGQRGGQRANLRQPPDGLGALLRVPAFHVQACAEEHAAFHRFPALRAVVEIYAFHVVCWQRVDAFPAATAALALQVREQVHDDLAYDVLTSVSWLAVLAVRRGGSVFVLSHCRCENAARVKAHLPDGHHEIVERHLGNLALAEYADVEGENRPALGRVQDFTKVAVERPVTAGKDRSVAGVRGVTRQTCTVELGIL